MKTRRIVRYLVIALVALLVVANRRLSGVDTPGALSGFSRSSRVGR